MNRFFSTSHLLSVLESPIGVGEFEKAMAQNPLFDGHCMAPAQFLWFLSEEGLLSNQAQHFVFSPAGKFLYQRILNWTARDKSAVRLKKQKWQAAKGVGSVDLSCPVCHSSSCVLHVFIILLEHFQLDYPSQSKELENRAALLDVLAQQYASKERVYALWESEGFLEWPHWSSVQIDSLLGLLSESPDIGLSAEEILSLSKTFFPLLFRGQPSPPPLQLISRLRYNHGLLNSHIQARVAACDPALDDGSALLRLCHLLPLASGRYLWVYQENTIPCALLLEPHGEAWRVLDSWRVSLT